MSSLDIGPQLVGRKVCNPARPEWGVGTVLRVQSTTVAGQPRHRISVQFAVGHRVLQVPPARLTDPQPEPQREAGWLESIGGNTIDDRLTRLPPSIAEFLGTPAQRLAALAALYAHSEEPTSLARWARGQTGAADPLSLWSRDELLLAYRRFSDERDAELRVAAAKLKMTGGPAALEAALADLPPEALPAVRAALAREI
ncbi:MAG: DUF3553 domain-containing protein [Phycisphaerae bacterium]|jgi:hypothetical protein